MRLNVQTDYALRLLMHLAVNGDQLSTIAGIAKHYGISKNHLMKVAQSLAREGFIETVRGRSGGLRLARGQDEITVGEVVRKIETDFALVQCLQGADGMCLITPACRLTHVLTRATEAFLRELDQHSIADLVADNQVLDMLLKSEAA
ncbi:MAG: Rrf2 family transcriptional regulator [Hyphomicrobiales bacterium]|nr:Rrf2 family transcriptional regulator [Hyphomicrobiales bacterium]